jgi:pimeloyl-ACP methyl ester carboxylesterase
MPKEARMAAYVLVPGGFCGAWYMRSLARYLQAAGHEAFAVTLTGLGERSHLARPDVGLETHILDVANTIEYEDLHDVILVGKSYSGLVVTGVAERVPERIAWLVYVNALIPLDGESAADLSPEMAAAYGAAASAFNGWQIPYRRGEGWRSDRRFSPHPFRTFTDAVSVKNPASARIPRAFIYGAAQEGSAAKLMLSGVERAKREGWRYYELPTGHEPEREMPRELADLLLKFA